MRSIVVRAVVRERLGREGSTDAYHDAKLNIPTAMRRRAGAWGKGVVKSTNIGTNIGTN